MHRSQEMNLLRIFFGCQAQFCILLCRKIGYDKRLNTVKTPLQLLKKQKSSQLDQKSWDDT